MKSAAPRATTDKVATPAAGKGTTMVDNRAAAVAQRQMQAAIDTSPRQVAQRQQAEVAAPRKNTTGLPDNLKAGVENLSGHSLDDVKVHYNSAKPAQLQAHAYAQGTDIHVAPGQEKHLPHEAWHVVQQKQGRVKATMQCKGMGVNNDIQLEREADQIGAKAASHPTHKAATQFPLSSVKGPIQFTFFSAMKKMVRNWMPKTAWHSPLFNKFYNIPFFGYKKLNRGMDRNEVNQIAETGILKSKSMLQSQADSTKPIGNRLSDDKHGKWGPDGRIEHLNKSYSPKSQYLSSVEPEHAKGNAFGDIQVPVEVPRHRTHQMDSHEKQTLIEGGTKLSDSSLEEVRKINRRIINKKQY